MACAFGLAELANRNAFIKDLEETGYLLDFVSGYLVAHGLPYLDKDGRLQFGDWASPLDLNGAVIDPPSDHQAWWHGSRPCDQAGRELRLGGGPASVRIKDGLTSDFSFSFKLLDKNGQIRAYQSFEEKVATYFDAITAPAIAAFPGTTPFRGIEIKAAAQSSPLKFPDTMSARYQMNDLSALLVGKKVAIIGLGGTGSYILDFISRTHLAQIALFDDDKVHVHTIFRFPGFILDAIGRPKAEVLAQHYDQWHGGVEAFVERITAENVHRLKEFDFVFVSVDKGPARLLIVDWLSANGVPYVDCGMGLNRSKVGLSGFIRVTGGDRKAFEDNVGTARLPVEEAKEDEYRNHAQITELNALNGAMAVIRFKQHFGLLDWESEATALIFDTATFDIV